MAQETPSTLNELLNLQQKKKVTFNVWMKVDGQLYFYVTNLGFQRMNPAWELQDFTLHEAMQTSLSCKRAHPKLEFGYCYPQEKPNNA